LSGTDFAIPAQTLFMARDAGLDSERSEAARTEVETWRREGNLPFPRLSVDRIHELAGTLDWPPLGSVELDQARQEASEPLSSAPEPEDVGQPTR
jgi:MscS family membrane protein